MASFGELKKQVEDATEAVRHELDDLHPGQAATVGYLVFAIEKLIDAKLELADAQRRVHE